LEPTLKESRPEVLVSRLTIVASLCFAVLLPAASASAQCFGGFSWEPPPVRFGWVAPSSTDTPVPTNTWIWYRANFGDDPVAADTIHPRLTLQPLNTQEPVELIGLGIVHLPDGALFAFQPAVELEPLTDHEVQFNRDLIEPELLMSVSFRTGEGPDQTPPAVPEVLGHEFFSDYNQLGACPDDVLDYSDEATWYVQSEGTFAFVAKANAVADGELFGDAWAMSETPELQIEGDIGVGTDLSVRISTVDLAGNFSGWSEPQGGRMPAAGCVSTDEGVSRASLLLAGLVLLAGRWRRRRRAKRAPEAAAWSPFAGPVGLGLAAALLLPLATPTVASAGEGDELEVELTANDRWRADLDRELKPIEDAWAGVSLGAGALQVTWLALTPARAPYALQLSIANTALWLPTVATLVVIASSRHSIRTARTVQRARRGIRGTAITLGVWSMVVGTFALPVGIALGVIYDPSVAPGVLSVPLSLMFSAIACEDLARRIERHTGTRRSATRRPPARILAAGPTGLVVVF